MASSTTVDALLYGWSKNLDYGQRLVGDLSSEQMVSMPVPGANHAAWILSHLNLYYPVLVNLLRREAFDDPKQHKFGMLSRPEARPEEYPPRQSLVSAFVDGHNAVEAALRAADESIFEAPQPLERWKPNMPKVGITLHYLMLVHENVHLGQLSAWRRMLGHPPV